LHSSAQEVSNEGTTDRKADEGAHVATNKRVGHISDQIHDENRQRQTMPPRRANPYTQSRDRAHTGHHHHKSYRREAHPHERAVRFWIETPDWLQDAARNEQRNARDARNDGAKQEEPAQGYEAC
jgi:hypothetical protein